MPEERDIEKQLRAAAEARRKAAGRFELHPVNRRHLQDEVWRTRGRHVANATPRRPAWKWFLSYRFASAVCLLAILCFGTWAYLRQPAPVSPPAATVPPPSLAELPKTVAVKSEISSAYLPPSVPAAAPPPAIATAPATGSAAPQQTLSDSANLQAIAKAGGYTQFADRKAPAAAAEPPSNWTAAPASGLAVYGAAPAADVNAVAQPAAGISSAATLAAPASKIADGMNIDSVSATVRTRAEQPRQAETVSGGAVTMQPGLATAAATYSPNGISSHTVALKQSSRRVRAVLLQSFELEQNGNRVRIVDGDGSVYEGSLLVGYSGGNPQNHLPASNSGNAVQQSGAVQQNALNQNTAAQQAANANHAAAPGFRFITTGTNLTLGQRVVITATAEPEPSGNAWKVRVTGWAVTADGRETVVNAVSK
jgi:hypothetical protein